VRYLRYFGNNTLSLHELVNSTNNVIDGINVPTDRVILAEQIHSANVKIVSEKYNCILIPGVDGLITERRNFFLAIKTADCIPILIWDEKQKIIAALHSGRVGTQLNIAKNAVDLMIDKFGCDPKNIQFELGPAICGNCYPVDRETFDDFVQKTGVEQIFPNLDLKKVVISNLRELGIPDKNIINHDICTKENSNYFSFRENQTKERQVSIIGMK